MGTEVLNLAEVELYDIFGNNVALNAAATQSSVYSGHSSHDFVPSRAVNGIKSDDDFMHTNEEQGMMTSLKKVVTNIDSQLNSTSLFSLTSFYLQELGYKSILKVTTRLERLSFTIETVDHIGLDGIVYRTQRYL